MSVGNAPFAAPNRLDVTNVDQLDKPPPGAASAAAAAPVRPSTAPRTSTTKTVSGRTGEVILLRGLMDVFSQGMDQLGGKLQDKGFTIQVLNHSTWQRVADELIRRHKATKYPEPVFLIGHSLGADAVILMSEKLAREKVPVALAITFDPVHPRHAPPNVRRFINFYQSNNGWGVEVKPPPGYKVNLVNTDLKDRTDISHTTIDKADFLHSKVVDEMIKLSKPVRRKVTG